MSCGAAVRRAARARAPGASAYIADVHPIFKAHLLLGMTIFLVFPFTRLVHIWSAPVWYLGRKGYQIVRTKKRPLPASGAVPVPVRATRR